MRKAILLAMAAAIVAMFAIPGAASGAWTKHHVTNATDTELEITGTDLRYVSNIGGTTCSKTISNVVFKGNSTTGDIKSFAPELNAGDTVTSVCQGTGALAQCDFHVVEGHNFPWTIHTATANTVTATTGTITTTMTGFFCPHTINLQAGMLTMTVAAGEVNTTSTASLSGTLVSEGDLGEVNMTLSGEVHVLGTITYGF